MLILRFTALLFLFCLFGLGNIAQSQNPNTSKGGVVGKDKKKTDDAGAKANGKIKKVEVDGVGDSAENALKDAQRNAVSKVVGVLVDSKVMVKNDKLIEDKILTFSNGFVKSYTVIPGSQVKSGKVYKVKIEAKVEVTGIENILKREKLVATGSVDGAALLSQSEKKEKIFKSGSEMLREKMKGFPENVLDIQMNEKATKILKNDGETSTVQYEITVKVDLEKYKVFAKQLTQVLDKVADFYGEGTLEFTLAKNSKEKEFIFGNNGYSNSKVYSLSTFLHAIKSYDSLKNSEKWQLAISTNRTSTGNSVTYKIYLLDKKIIEEITKNKNISDKLVGNFESIGVLEGKIKMKFLDVNGNEILSKTLDALKPGERIPYLFFLNKDCKCILINSVFVNLFKSNAFESHFTSFKLTPKVDIPNEDLKKVKKVQIVVE